jgi:hypothetical protein
MAQDLAQTAAQLVQFLAPFLPYLLKAGEEAAQEAGKKFGADAWEQAKALWGKLRPRERVAQAAQDLAAAPAGTCLPTGALAPVIAWLGGAGAAAETCRAAP